MRRNNIEPERNACKACQGEGHPANANGDRSACDRCGGGGWEPAWARMLRIAHVARMATEARDAR